MEMIYVFDADGTLNQPRAAIEPAFNKLFRKFAELHPVYLITGSDRKKNLEQLPADTINACRGIFACSGSEFWVNNRLVYRKEHEFPKSLIAAIEHLIDTSSYPLRFGYHVEQCAGKLNISTVGRSANLAERKAYYTWDKSNLERIDFIKLLSKSFSEYQYFANDEISVDIVPSGWTNAVVKTEIELRHPGCSITFYGDCMNPGRNDKPLAEALKQDQKHHCVPVKDYLTTWALLQMSSNSLVA